MTARLVVSPIYRIDCDEPGCMRFYQPDTAWNQSNWRAARIEAAELGGWQVRPNGGPGSRSAPDYCPNHREFACPRDGVVLEWMGDQWYCHHCGDEYGPSPDVPAPGEVPDGQV